MLRQDRVARQITHNICFAGRRAGILKWFELELSCGYLEVNPVQNKSREAKKNARALILAEPKLAAKQVSNVKPSRDVKHDRYRFRELLTSRVRHCIR